jgi:cation:H+ antiporter
MVYLVLLAGLALLLGGGETLVRGAVAIASRLHVPPLVIGLTIVALGTSAPELTVSMGAAFKGAQDIVTGNVVGSNIANILLVLGLTGMIAPINVEHVLMKRDSVFLISVTVLMVGLALYGQVGAIVGASMVLLFCAYTAYAYIAERDVAPSIEKAETEELAAENIAEHSGVPDRLTVAVPVFLAGCGAVVYGADLLVDSAIEIARIFEVPEAVIGLSLVAVGTSLPELAVSVIAAFRGHPAVALGNVIGSNIANVLVILGATAVVTPIAITRQIVHFDVWVMLVSTVLLIPILMSDMRLSRLEASSLVLAYVIYMIALYSGWPALI